MNELDVAAYCREIESYLCRKNDGHLIRVVGPSFERVSGWAAQGIPLRIAFRGIDKYFDRYYRSGPRRRPVRVDFCEPDVMETFDEWRRALGLPRAQQPRAREEAAPELHERADTPGAEERARSRRSAPSLAEHLERAVLKLTNARAAGTLGDVADSLIDRVVSVLDAARAAARGLRGDARRALLDRLTELDAELLRLAHAALPEDERRRLSDDAWQELAAYRATMAPSALERAHGAALARLVRERMNLPSISYE